MNSLLSEHLGYLSDEVRLALFERACTAVIRPGDRVADLGCGAGVLGLLSLQAGAGHVYEIDEGPIINVARDTFAKAGVDDRATFLRARVQQTSLPEAVDVVICDHVGFVGFDYGIVELLRYARQHLLKPGGKIIPQRLEIEVAAVASNELMGLMSSWQAPGIPDEYHWLAGYSTNAKHGINLSRQDVLSDAAQLADIDLGVEHDNYFSWETTLTVSQDGDLHGLGAWFRSELAPGIWMTNSPLADDAIRRCQVFLPAGNVAVKQGDVIKLTVSARPADNVIAWDFNLPDGQTISHSTWEAMLFDTDQISRLQSDHVPMLTRQGRARAIVLGYCDGKRSLTQIQQAVLAEHPDLFPTEAEISGFVASVLGRNTA